MLTEQDIIRIRQMVERNVGLTLPYTAVTEGAGLTVTLHQGCAAITAEDRNALARGFFLLARTVKEHRAELHVCQHRHFASCGAMIDVSRNAVMTVEAIKRAMDKLAMLGMNLLLLYTEDTYEVPEYPYLGYMRGRYSQAELRELDDYAASLDIELMPCIQTLGHMAQFLQWQSSYPLQEDAQILQPDLP